MAMTGDMFAALGAIAVGLTGLAGVVYTVRDRRARETGTDITAHAETVLKDAMAWQADTIEGLRQRIVALEAEVVACEVGRTADRADFDRKLAAMEKRILDQLDP